MAAVYINIKPEIQHHCQSCALINFSVFEAIEDDKWTAAKNYFNMLPFELAVWV